MNSEELEASLRTEFESYLKEIFVEMRQELSQLQEKVASEIESHKSTLDNAFNELMSRVETDKGLDVSFKETVVEHLRLARDEGASITAMAIAQAEEMEKEAAAALPPPVVVAPTGIKEIHEAIADISSKTSQPDILKSLVHHAANFASRGAFFIMKNEHLVGWRVFGKDRAEDREKIREVFLSVAADSILSASIKSLGTVEGSAGTYSGDADILNKLDFNEPQKMVAMPLVARGRGVAVLYADQDTDEEVNVEALETLVRVAGLTVEVLASAKTSPVVVKKDFVNKPTGELTEEASVRVKEPTYKETTESAPAETSSNYQNFVEEPSVEPVEELVTEPVAETQAAVTEPVAVEPVAKTFDDSELAAPTVEEAAKEEAVSYSFDADDYQVEEVHYETPVETEENQPLFEDNSWSQPVEDTSWSTTRVEATKFSAQEYAENFAKETDPAEYAKEFSYQSPVETNEPVTAFDDYQIETPTKTAHPVEDNKFGSFEIENVKADQTIETFTTPIETFTPPVETVPIPVITTPAKTRLSERNVDLPIEVSEDERRLHNDARRFARLLVSEIKLYNEQKVKEGRDSNDIYERLREAIDRSREMYDKRVQPPVAAKFDYFHYELVNTLAEGDDNKLGSGYPGSSI